MKPLKSIECLTLDTPSFAQGNRVDERVRARCRYCCSVSPTTIPIAPTGVPDGSRVCSSSHGSLGCFHIIQPIRWAGFGSLIINVDSIQSIFRHFLLHRLLDVTARRPRGRERLATLCFTCRVTVCSLSEHTGGSWLAARSVQRAPKGFGAARSSQVSRGSHDHP